MANGWTLERRKKQSEKIKQWKPWTKATGPKTTAGKRLSCQNSLKHGGRCASVRKIHKLLADYAQLEKEVKKIIQ